MTWNTTGMEMDCIPPANSSTRGLNFQLDISFYPNVTKVAYCLDKEKGVSEQGNLTRHNHDRGTWIDLLGTITGFIPNIPEGVSRTIDPP